MTEWELTEESLNLFLSWLSVDRDAAGRKYEDIRRRLTLILEYRGCAHADEIADEAINRFIRRLPELIETYKGDPFPYILVIARNVQREWEKKQALPLPDNLDEVPADPPVDPDEIEQLVHDCLDRCLSQLESKNRDLVLDYYLNEKQEKIEFRKKLAKQSGIALNALRIKVHRIRTTVHTCMNTCLGNKVPFEMK
jgi:DNA-directed RNA polymerase specialized sigma24 family protein